MIDLDQKVKPREKSYADIIRDMEVVYSSDLTDRIFNLGADIYGRHKGTNYPLCPKIWFAWMRNSDFKIMDDKVVVGCVGDVRNKMFWLENINKHLNKFLEYFFEKPIYYGLDGELHNLAGHEPPKDHDYAAQCFAEVRANVKKFTDNSKNFK